MWSERFDRPLDDVFALQDEIALNVVSAIEPSLRRAEVERVKRKRPDSLDAYDLVLQAQPDVDSGMPAQVTKALVLLDAHSRSIRPMHWRTLMRPCAIIVSFCGAGCAKKSARLRSATLRPPSRMAGRCACSDPCRVFHRHGRARSRRRLHRVRGRARD